MIENIFFGKTVLPGESIRIILAFLGVLIATYFDIFNRRNVPDKFLYAFLVVAFIANLAFYDADLFLFSLAMAIFFSAIFYVFYRMGQLGGADVIVMASVMLLLPIHPSFVKISFNFPFLFSTLVFSGTVFALYVIIYYGAKLFSKGANPKWGYALMLIPYALFVYIYFTSQVLFSPVYLVLITVLFVATTFFLMFKDDLNKLLSEQVPLSRLETEDVLALDIMDQKIVKKYQLKRLVNDGEIKRLTTAGLKEVIVYSKLPPFMPFFLVGMIIAMLYASTLLFL